MLYEAGAKEVHVRLACPEIKYPDFYGVDMPSENELLANNKNNKEMCDHIQAKSLKFLSLDGLYKALINEKREAATQKTEEDTEASYPPGAQLCQKCFATAVVMMDGCMTCLGCGDSKCG